MYMIGLVAMIIGLIAYGLYTQSKSQQLKYICYGIWGVASAYLTFVILTLTIDNPLFNAVNGIVFCVIVLWMIGLLLARRYVPQDEPLFLRALIVTGFVWLNSSIWFQPSMYVTATSLYITGLFLWGIQTNTLWYRRYAYLFSLILAGYIGQKYLLTRWVHPHNTVQLTYIFGLLTTLLFVIRAVFHKHKKILTQHELSKVEPLLHILITIIILIWGRALIIIRFDEPQAPGSFFMRQFGGYNNVDTILLRTGITDILLRIYYALFAVITLTVGIIKKERGFIYLSALLVLLVLYKIWCLLAGLQNTLYETIAALFVGGFVVVCAYVYQKANTKIK